MENPETVTAEIVPAGVVTGEIVHASPVVRDEIRDRWLNGRRRPNTRAAYKVDIDQFFAWCDAEGIDPLQARRHHIDRYATWMDGRDLDTRYPTKRRYSASTQARKLTAVSSYFEYIVVETDGQFRNPCANVERPNVSPNSTTNGLTDDEANALVAAAIDDGPMAEALVRLLLTTGMRISEAVEASTGDLGWDRGERVITVTRKGGEREKLLIGEGAGQALDRYLAGRRGALFVKKGQPINRQQANYLLRKLSQKAGVHVRISPHSLRHTAATSALDDGLSLRDVQNMLGHKDPRTTNRYDRARQNLKNSPTRTLDAKFTGARPTDQGRQAVDRLDVHDGPLS